METYKPTKIVKFSGGDELTDEEARSGPFVFAAGPEPEPEAIFAFDDAQAEDQVDEWAKARGLSDALALSREVIGQLPDDPSSEVDEYAERAEVERITSRLDELSSENDVPAIGTPEFLRIAHDRRVFDSAILYQQANFVNPPCLGLTQSSPDLKRLGWTAGANSCETIGFQVVCLYEQANYGPVRLIPMCRLFGNAKASRLPRPALSVLFI
jgi:hypothetical protein